MSDSFEFTLHNPLTEEDWDKLSDVELENTTSVTFQTPQGRQAKYIKCEVIDKIIAEIEEQVLESLSDGGDDWFTAEKVNECLEIIDKYKADKE
jgi:hypothetical protein